MSKDIVNPEHYKALGAKCPNCSHPIEVSVLTRQMGYNLGNAVKYSARAPFKGEFEADLNKAAWYIHDESVRFGYKPRYVDRFTFKPETAVAEIHWTRAVGGISMEDVIRQVHKAVPTLVTKQIEEIEKYLRPHFDECPEEHAATVVVRLTRAEREHIAAILKDYENGQFPPRGMTADVIKKLEHASGQK